MKYRELINPNIAKKLSNTLFKDTKISLAILKYVDVLYKNLQYLNKEIEKVNNSEQTREEKISNINQLLDAEIVEKMPVILIDYSDFENSISSTDESNWLSGTEIRDIVNYFNER